MKLTSIGTLSVEPYYQFSVLYIYIYICTSLNFLLVFLNIQIEYMFNIYCIKVLLCIDN